MNKFHVTANAADFGIIEAADAQDARDTAADMAGYKGEADMAAQIGQPSEIVATEVEVWIAWLDGARDEAEEFPVPLGGTFDVAAAGARALGVDVCAELNVERT